MVDQHGNSEADTVADLGRRHQSEVLVDASRRLLQARSHWYPVITDLHRFMIAIARVSVNHGGKGGTAPDPLVWDQGSRPKVRKLAIRINVDFASLPGPPGFLNSSWVQVDAGRITGSDFAAWPYSVSILVRFTSFLSTLHWLSGAVDFGHFGISFLELLILFEQWTRWRRAAAPGPPAPRLPPTRTVDGANGAGDGPPPQLSTSAVKSGGRAKTAC